MDIRQVIANALIMDEGDMIVIPAINDRDAENLRVRLYITRNKIPAAKALIHIQKRAGDGGIPVIYVTRTGPPAQLPKFNILKIEDKPDLRRMVKLAIEDGNSMEEVLEMFSEIAAGDELVEVFTEESLIFKQLTEEEDAQNDGD